MSHFCYVVFYSTKTKRDEKTKLYSIQKREKHDFINSLSGKTNQLILVSVQTFNRSLNNFLLSIPDEWIVAKVPRKENY